MLGPVEKALGVSCRDFTRLASAKLDQPLSAGERSRYLLHRLICDICRRQERRMRQVNALAAESLRRASSTTEAQLDAAARERIRERVAREIAGS